MKRLALGGHGALLARDLRGLKRALLAGASALCLASLAVAGPEGGNVVAGAATISNPSATQTQIDQSTDKAIINWNSFDVGANESAVFHQPNSASVTLNRIFDQDASIIAGQVSANGRLILVNANGMVFENGASVNTAGLIATTADISNNDFMAGNYAFNQAGAANASIVNNGQITAEEGGVVAFVAPSVRNSGVITAKLGTVALGAGNTFTLDLYGDNLISFPVSAEVAQQLTGPDGQPLNALVDVSGKIDAGTVQLTARAARGIIDSVINVDGEIIASGVQQSAGGGWELVGNSGTTQNVRTASTADGNFPAGYGGAIEIDGGQNRVDVGGTLTASGTTGGSISLTGSRVDVAGSLSATGSSGQGGAISIGGKEINLSDATLNASGATGGGSIAVGFTGSGSSRNINADTVFVSQGSTLKADAIESGDGGRIEFWSNIGTDFRGTMSATGGASSGDGGFLEVSSKGDVGFMGTADASAPNGEAGVLSLDPKNITISTGFGNINLPSNPLTYATSSTSSLTINPNSITSVLNTGTAVTLQASNDITVSSNIIANNPGGNGGALTMQAGRSVLINADITTDNGNLTIIANELLSSGVINAQRDPGSAVITMGFGADIVAGTGTVRLAILNGAGKTNLTSGDLTVRNISAGNILVENLGATAGSDVNLSGNLVASGTGTPLVVASQTGTFDNNNGSNALQTPNGRWLVYTNTGGSTDEGGLAGTPWYNTSYNPANPTGISATGNKFVYSQTANLTVRPNNATRVYGDPNPAFTYGITGLINGDSLAAAVQGAPTISTTATASSSVAGGPYAINAALGTLASAYNYGFTFAPGSLTITAAQLTFQADLKTREYGDANGVLTGTLGGLKNGDTIGSIASGTLQFVTNADIESGIGSYEIVGGGITITSANYSTTVTQAASNATALTIVPAQLTYLADIVTRVYGDVDVGQVGGELLGLKNGDDPEEVGIGTVEFLSSVTETSGAGVYAVNGGGLLVTNPNYVTNILQAPTNATAFTITPAQLFYVADDEDREYGEVNQPLSGQLEGLVNDDTLEEVVSGTMLFSTSATQTSNAGLYAIDGSGLTVISGNYEINIIQDEDNATAFEITPARLTFIADQATRIYGDANPAFTGQLVGFKNTDTLEEVTDGTMVFTSSANELSNVGTYEIEGGGLIVTSGNYELVIDQESGNQGALEVIPAQLFYTANPFTRVYGQLNPTITGMISGLKNNDTVASVALGQALWQAEADETSNVGFYGIEGSGLVITSGNYEQEILQSDSNQFAISITPAQLFYLANPSSRLAGYPNPVFTGSVLGLANGESIDEITGGDLLFTTNADGSSLGGLYAINGSGLVVTSINYSATILQDPSNATALTIQDIPSQAVQANGESTTENDGAVNQEQNDMSSRPNELGIVGVDTVTDDMGDGKNDQLADQLCVLGAAEAANAPGCVAQQQTQGR
jgi:filamentous hemagglutinin family protein